MLRRSLRWLPDFIINNPLNPWGRTRDMPDAPKQSFREWYLKNRK